MASFSGVMGPALGVMGALQGQRLYDQDAWTKKQQAQQEKLWGQQDELYKRQLEQQDYEKNRRGIKERAEDLQLKQGQLSYDASRLQYDDAKTASKYKNAYQRYQQGVRLGDPMSMSAYLQEVDPENLQTGTIQNKYNVQISPDGAYNVYRTGADGNQQLVHQSKDIGMLSEELLNPEGVAKANMDWYYTQRELDYKHRQALEIAGIEANTKMSVANSEAMNERYDFVIQQKSKFNDMAADYLLSQGQISPPTTMNIADGMGGFTPTPQYSVEDQRKIAEFSQEMQSTYVEEGGTPTNVASRTAQRLVERRAKEEEERAKAAKEVVSGLGQSGARGRPYSPEDSMGVGRGKVDQNQYGPSNPPPGMPPSGSNPSTWEGAQPQPPAQGPLLPRGAVGGLLAPGIIAAETMKPNQPPAPPQPAPQRAPMPTSENRGINEVVGGATNSRDVNAGAIVTTYDPSWNNTRPGGIIKVQDTNVSVWDTVQSANGRYLSLVSVPAPAGGARVLIVESDGSGDNYTIVETFKSNSVSVDQAKKMFRDVVNSPAAQ